MTIPELIQIQRKHPDDIYLLPQGSFYHAYNEGALRLSYPTGYMLRVGHYRKMNIPYTFCGFPISSLDKVLVTVSLYYKSYIVSLDEYQTSTIIRISPCRLSTN